MVRLIKQTFHSKPITSIGENNGDTYEHINKKAYYILCCASRVRSREFRCYRHNCVDDFDGLNTAVANDLAITKSENGLELKFGAGTSSLGRDAYGTGTSTFGQSGAWFDGSYAKFGNSGNQQQLDIRLQTIPVMTRN